MQRPGLADADTGGDRYKGYSASRRDKERDEGSFSYEGTPGRVRPSDSSGNRLAAMACRSRQNPHGGKGGWGRRGHVPEGISSRDGTFGTKLFSVCWDRGLDWSTGSLRWRRRRRLWFRDGSWTSRYRGTMMGSAGQEAQPSCQQSDPTMPKLPIRTDCFSSARALSCATRWRLDRLWKGALPNGNGVLDGDRWERRPSVTRCCPSDIDGLDLTDLTLMGC